MIFGYARVSTQGQHLDFQVDALQKYGGERIYTEKMTGIKGERPQLNAMLDHLRKDDTVVARKLNGLDAASSTW